MIAGGIVVAACFLCLAVSAERAYRREQTTTLRDDWRPSRAILRQQDRTTREIRGC